MFGLLLLLLGHTQQEGSAPTSGPWKVLEVSFLPFPPVAHAFSSLWSYVHMPSRLRQCTIFLPIAFIPISCNLSFNKLPFLCLVNYIITSCKLSSCKLSYLNLVNYHIWILQTIILQDVPYSLANCYIFSVLGRGVWSHCSRDFDGLEKHYLDSGRPRQAFAQWCKSGIYCFPLFACFLGVSF